MKTMEYKNSNKIALYCCVNPYLLATHPEKDGTRQNIFQGTAQKIKKLISYL